jgi:hypothetical protein
MNFFKIVISISCLALASCGDTLTTTEVSTDSTSNIVDRDPLPGNSLTDSTQPNTTRYSLEQLPMREVAELILKDSIRPTSSPIIYKMLDSLSSDSKLTRQYYFKVFNKIMNKADGEIAESIGGYALTYVQNYPKEFLDNTKGFSKNSIEAWASNIGIELFLVSNENVKAAYDQVVVLFNDNCKDCNAYYKGRLKEFNAMILQTIQENQQSQK